jgi:hypothetical protein
MATAAFKAAYLELVPQFERASGHKVITTWTNTTDIVGRIKAGEATNLAVMAANAIDEVTCFASGRHIDTQVADAANALIAFFKAPAAYALIRDKGMEPA